MPCRLVPPLARCRASERKEMAIRVERVFLDRQIHPGKSKPRFQFAPPRRSPAIDDHVGMMEYASVAWPDRHCLHPSHRSDRHRNHKIPKHFVAAGAQMIRLGHLEHHVRRTQLPFGSEFGNRRRVSGRPGERPLTHPILNQADLSVAQAARLEEFPIPGLRLPRRHESPLRHVGDLPRMSLYVGITQEGERPRLARPMAGRTAHKRSLRRVEKVTAGAG